MLNYTLLLFQLSVLTPPEQGFNLIVFLDHILLQNSCVSCFGLGCVLNAVNVNVRSTANGANTCYCTVPQ